MFHLPHTLQDPSVRTSGLLPYAIKPFQLYLHINYYTIAHQSKFATVIVDYLTVAGLMGGVAVFLSLCGPDFSIK